MKIVVEDGEEEDEKDHDIGGSIAKAAGPNDHTYEEITNENVRDK